MGVSAFGQKLVNRHDLSAAPQLFLICRSRRSISGLAQPDRVAEATYQTSIARDEMRERAAR
jgi:hypothetical protein